MKRVRDMQMDMGDIYTYDVWDGDDCIVKNPSPYSSLEQAKEAAREYLLENFVPTDRSKDDGFQMALVYNGNETISSGSFDNSYVIASWNKHNNSIAEFNFPKWLRKFAKNPNENLSKWYYNVDKYTDVMDSRRVKDARNTEFNETLKNAKKAAKRDGYDQCITIDANGDYSILRVSKPEYRKLNSLVDDVPDIERIVAVVIIYWQGGIAQLKVEKANDITTPAQPVSDSRKIKDENTPDVLDGVLFIAFTDGTEDDMIAEVNKHANESDTIDGVQYETYETDNSDGVAMIDMCAATGDANAFVKALLNKWGIAENVADLEFEASDEMKEAVNDSRKQVQDNNDAFLNQIKEDVENDKMDLDKAACELYQAGYFDELPFNRDVIELCNIDMNKYRWVGSMSKKLIEKPLEEAIRLLGDDWTLIEQYEGGYYEGGYHDYYYKFVSGDTKESGDEEYITLITDGKYVIDVWTNMNDPWLVKTHRFSDSRVNDMTKPVHLRGYAEKMRAKRRNKNADDEPNTDEEKPNVSDSRRVRDERQTFKGQYIGDSPFAKQYESFVDELLKSGKMKRGDLSQTDIHDKFEEEMLETSESGDDFEVWAYNDDPRFGDYGEADAGIFVEYDKDGYVTDIYTVG